MYRHCAGLGSRLGWRWRWAPRPLPAGRGRHGQPPWPIPSPPGHPARRAAANAAGSFHRQGTVAGVLARPHLLKSPTVNESAQLVPSRDGWLGITAARCHDRIWPAMLDGSRECPGGGPASWQLGMTVLGVRGCGDDTTPSALCSPVLSTRAHTKAPPPRQASPSLPPHPASYVDPHLPSKSSTQQRATTRQLPSQRCVGPLLRRRSDDTLTRAATGSARLRWSRRFAAGTVPRCCTRWAVRAVA